MTNGDSKVAQWEQDAGKRVEDKRTQTVAQQEQPGGTPLRSLLEGVDVRSAVPSGEMCIRQVACDSRKVAPGALFVAIQGAATDGNLYARDALSHGATAVLSAAEAPSGWPREIPWLRVNEPRKALAIVAANIYGRPAKALMLVGVSGT